MQVTIELDGSWSTITSRDIYHEDVAKMLEGCASFKVPNAHYAAIHVKNGGWWDGRTRLYKKSKYKNHVRLASGLVDLASAALEKKGVHVEVVDVRGKRTKLNRPLSWEGYDLFDYQQAAVDAVMNAYENGVSPGGLLKMPIRSGKTLTSAYITYKLGLNTVFVAPSKRLVSQTYEAYSQFLGNADIGVLADGRRDLDAPILITTPQSIIAAPDGDMAKLQARRGLLFLDEVHHKGNGAKKWREGVMKLNPHFTIGLSATFNLDEDDANEFDQTIWLRGICGPVLYEIPMSDLVKRGRICDPIVKVFDYESGLQGRDQRVALNGKGIQGFNKYVTNFEPRLRAIAKVAAQAARVGFKVLIDTSTVTQTNNLKKMCREELGSSKIATIVGATKSHQQDKIVKAFCDGGYSIIISNVLGEGIDIPPLEVVINASGGSSYAATIQRLRCLTPYEGKSAGLILEPYDAHNKNAAKACDKRVGFYEDEDCFDIEHVSISELLGDV